LEVLSLVLLAISYISSLTGEGLLNFSAFKSYKVSSTKSFPVQRVGLAAVYAMESIFKNRSLQAAYHLSFLLGSSSIFWSGHIIHCSIPVSRGQMDNAADVGLSSLWSLNFPTNPAAWSSDSLNHVLGSQLGSGSSSLTFISGLRPDSCSIFLSDIAHHHLSLGCLLIWASGLYCSLYKGFAHRVRTIAAQGPYGLTPSVSNLNFSTHAQLSLSLFGVALVL
jgi:photosystem I P700 chlorophyll a apoprotein A2